MSDQREFIDAERRALAEELRFFSNAAKPERERWVASEFLTKLGMSFNEGELVSPRESDVVDVAFREARFQIKEIIEPNRHRGAELKARFTQAQVTTNYKDLIGTLEAYDVIITDAYSLMLEFATLPKYPQQVKSGLDLLFYITRPYCNLGSEKKRQELAATG